MKEIVLPILIGVVAGITSGLFGIGGGLIIVPALVLLLAFDQKMAQGTSLAVFLLPVGMLGVWKYWQENAIQISTTLLVAAGLVGGSLVGATLATQMDPDLLRKSFAVFLAAVALYLFFK